MCSIRRASLTAPLLLLFAGIIATSLQAQDLKEPVRTAAEKKVGGSRTSEVKVVRVQSQRDKFIKNGNLEISFPSRSGRREGLTRAFLSAEGKDVGTALLDIQRYDSVMVIQKQAKPDQPVGAADVSPRRTEISDFRGDPLTRSEFQAMIKKGEVVASHRLTGGQALRNSDVRPPQATDVGRPVRMLYRRGEFILRLSCEAREPGSKGEEVRIYCQDTKKTYRARLVRARMATWIETL